MHVGLYQGSLTAQSFMQHVRDAAAKMGKPFALFIDGASYHKSKEIVEDLEALNITRIINVPLSP